MTAFNSFSHGTQDLYPTLLEKDHGLIPSRVGLIVVISNIGAMLGGIISGALSEKFGRKRMIIIAALSCDSDDSAMGLVAYRSHAGPGRVPDAVCRAGSLRRRSRPTSMNFLPGRCVLSFPASPIRLGNLVFLAQWSLSGGTRAALFRGCINDGHVVDGCDRCLRDRDRHWLGREARGEDWSKAEDSLTNQQTKTSPA